MNKPIEDVKSSSTEAEIAEREIQMEDTVFTSLACPQCGKTLKIPARVDTHVRRYLRPVVSASSCCGYAVRITPSVRLSVSIPNNPKNNVDDFGCKIKTKKEVNM